MKTKRELLIDYAKGFGCKFVKCSTCPYHYICYSKSENTNLRTELEKIGAMAILRMFPEKKKPLLEIGTKIKFSDGKIATITKVDCDMVSYYDLEFRDGHRETVDYLIGRTWEIVE
jgi:hypothetical protein